MKIYLVGGAVRDTLLGIPVSERDWVVVGADREQMLAAGFVPVDRDFPVFRHPRTGEEYALARRETKRGEGYRGFEIDAGADVTLAEDLRRRDLTINAMARTDDGELIDPHNGCADLDKRVLRHVGAAFDEDPLRVLRVARFAAKLGRHGFRVAHDTHRLMRDMVARGAIGHLKAERVWRELSRAMATDRPWRFFEVLQACGALAVMIPPLAARIANGQAHANGPDSAPIAALKRITARSTDPTARLAAVLWACIDDADQARRLARALRADRASTRLLVDVGASRTLCAGALSGDVDALTALAERWQGIADAHRRTALVEACGAQSAGPKVAEWLTVALAACAGVAADALRARGIEGAALGAALKEARQAAARAALRELGLLI